MAEDIAGGLSEHGTGAPTCSSAEQEYRKSPPGTASVSSPNAKTNSERRLRRGERVFAALFAPLCLAAFFAARSFGQQLKASGYAEGILSAYDKVVQTIPSAMADDEAAGKMVETNPSLTADDEAADMIMNTQPALGKQSREFGMNSNAAIFETLPLSRKSGVEREMTKRTVYILPQQAPNPAGAGELKHFIQDAVKRSAVLEETHDPLDQDAAWVYDPVRLKWTVAIEIVRNVTNERIVKFGRDKYRPWDFIIIDYNDDGFMFWSRVGDGMKEAMQSDRPVVRFATRRHVHKRALDVPKNDEDHFEPLGEPIDWTSHKQIGSLNGVPRILRYGVRSDLVEHLEKKFGGGTFYDSNVDNTVTVGERQFIDLVSLNRTVDVFSPWRLGADVNLAKHRNGIALALKNMAEEYSGVTGDPTKPKLEMMLSPIGQRARIGRNTVQSEYVDALLKSKIVVSSQRDRWEDHYRLMEGLACGALVLTDPMSTFPLHLTDGESLVVYRSLSELKEKILYYLKHDDERLAIARRGHHIAMNHHRSWHGLERIIFGDWSKPMGRRRRRRRRL